MNDTSSNTNPLYPGVNVPDKIIVHHTAYASDVPQYPLVNEWHRLRGFPLSTLGSYVGYHYLIEKDGSFTQCRSLTEGGAHTLGQNFTSVGICMAGNFDTQGPTSAQKSTLLALIKSVMIQYPTITGSDIYPHRHFNKTSCYGSGLPDDFVQLEVKAFNDSISMNPYLCTEGMIGK